MNVLVLCHANRWRSALVHGYLAELVRQDRLCGYNIQLRSAGFKEAGRPAGKPIRDVALELGFSLESHRSRLISVDDVLWADLIVHMGSGNSARLHSVTQLTDDLYFHMSKARCLGEWCTPVRSNIQDFAFLKRGSEEFDRVVKYAIAACQKLMQEVIVPRAIEEQHKR
jgi:protein-tyrosine-phosphatase